MSDKEMVEVRLRVPKAVHEWVQADAEANRRTILNEYLYKLELWHKLQINFKQHPGNAMTFEADK